MPFSCAIYGCQNTTKKKKEGIIFYRFPQKKDFVSTNIRNQWISCCGRADKVKPENKRICSVHFREEDYERDLQNELLNLPLRNILKKTAVPTLNLGGKTDQLSFEEIPREKRLSGKRNQEIVNELITSGSASSNVDQSLLLTSKGDTDIGISKPEIESISYKQRVIPFKCAVLECKNQSVNYKEHQNLPYKYYHFPTDPKYSQEWKRLCRLPSNTDIRNLKVCSEHFELDDYVKNKRFKGKLIETALPLLNNATAVKAEEEVVEDKSIKQTSDRKLYEISKLKNEIQKLRRRNKWIRENIRRKEKLAAIVKEEIRSIEGKSEDEILKSVFSEAQVNLLKGNINKVYWSDDDLAQAFTLRHMGGKDLYLYLKNTLNYPLPALSCVQAWAAN